MQMSHMVADTQSELLRMAAIIGVNHKWLQKKGTAHEHFDICKAKRALALKAGVIAVTSQELVTIIRNKH